MIREKTSPEFEAWFKERLWHECYEDVKHHLFAAWQASRAAIEVELPTAKSPRNTEIIKAVGRSLIAQGFKVKS